MKPLLPYFYLCLVACFCLPIRAGDLPAYRVGDIAQADIVTPVPLDVVDAAATAALKSARARQFPAVFRSFPGATNLMTREFLDAFAQARTNFLNGVAGEFHSHTLDEPTIASAAFGQFVTAFGVENKDFPVTDELAAEWARGGAGQVIQDKLLAALRWAADMRIRPDALPPGMVVGETVRLVPVTSPNQKLSLDVVQQGELVPAANLTPLSNVQTLFRREFPAGQQLLARALAAFLQPNCFPDAPFTQLTRGTTVYQLVVADHFDAGDAIVRRGDTIDAKIVSALMALNEKLKSVPPVAPAASPKPVSVAAAQPKSTPPPAPAHTSVAVAAPATVTSIPAPPATDSSPPQTAVRAGLPHLWLILTLAGISVFALVVAVFQFLKDKKSVPVTVPAAQSALPLLGTTSTALAPQVEQAVREAVQQELAQQRRELLLAQQTATDEIAALVHRLDELQVPMQERLQTYESRIQMLEKELALRNEENRELLKLKIEMISNQLKSERATTSMTSITA